MKTYFLTKELRPELRKVWGKPIFGSKKEVGKKFREICQKKKFKKIITVGDYCSRVLISDVKIFDGKIKKRGVKKLPNFTLNCKNPAGTIQKGIWPILKKAIKNNENVFIDGEEDLLVIPVILLSSNKTVVVYGFPQKGICLIEVNERMKRKIKNLLKLFLKCGQ